MNVDEEYVYSLPNMVLNRHFGFHDLTYEDVISRAYEPIPLVQKESLFEGNEFKVITKIAGTWFLHEYSCKDTAEYISIHLLLECIFNAINSDWMKNIDPNYTGKDVYDIIGVPPWHIRLDVENNTAYVTHTSMAGLIRKVNREIASLKPI